MDEEAELRDAVGEPGRRSRVVGVRVDGDCAARQWRHRRLAGGAFVVEAAGCDDHEFGALVAHLFP